MATTEQIHEAKKLAPGEIDMMDEITLISQLRQYFEQKKSTSSARYQIYKLINSDLLERLQGLYATMGGVIKKFFFASMFMSIVPVAILYGFNHNLLPGKILLC
ncbi:hypothetical protein FH972_013238 [Carpinus fangiana]|uniref:Uncharacterized protein n=1 Tax=Carpinus fangiana TaxID=176857 RepID=A0A5N6R6D0_9ROSI|nr:hypothetical protein FH972_013238 [Carpinus fangiana]